MMTFIASFIFMSMVLMIPVYGLYRKVDIFTAFGEGASDGVQTIMRMLPFVIGMFTAIRMLRASKFFETMSYILGPMLNSLGIPIEILPLMLIRPFSGAASNGFLVDILKEHGGNSMLGMMAATIMGSTDTTLYIIAFYFGAVGVKKMRYAFWTSLLADFAGMLVAVYLVPHMFV